MTGIPARNVVIAAVATPVGPDYRPDGELLLARSRQLLAEGCSMKEVAARLDVTPRTVAFHKYQMMRQLELKSTAELIQYAVKHHVIEIV